MGNRFANFMNTDTTWPGCCYRLDCTILEDVKPNDCFAFSAYLRFHNSFTEWNSFHFQRNFSAKLYDNTLWFQRCLQCFQAFCLTTCLRVSALRFHVSPPHFPSPILPFPSPRLPHRWVQMSFWHFRLVFSKWSATVQKLPSSPVSMFQEGEGSWRLYIIYAIYTKLTWRTIFCGGTVQGWQPQSGVSRTLSIFLFPQDPSEVLRNLANVFKTSKYPQFTTESGKGTELNLKRKKFNSLGKVQTAKKNSTSPTLHRFSF